jgi:hypothetical protein
MIGFFDNQISQDFVTTAGKTWREEAALTLLDRIYSVCQKFLLIDGF